MQGLADLRRDSFSEAHPVALMPTGAYTWGELMGHVAALRPIVAGASMKRWALYEDDSYRFLVGLLSLLAEGQTVYIPGDNHLGVVDGLSRAGVRFLGNFPDVDATPIIANPLRENDAPLRLCGDMVVYTSGSSGEPKALPKSLAQIDAELASLEVEFGGQLGSCAMLGTVSHQHLYGFLFLLSWPLCSGRPFWHRSFVDPLILARRAARLDGTAWVMSPGHLHRLSADMPWKEVRAGVKAVFSSGGPLDYSAAAVVNKGLGQAPWEVLGSSETGGIARRQQLIQDEPWQSMSAVETKVSSEGTLQVKSAFLPESGWYRTTDQAEILADGRFRLGRRVDRIVKLEGKRISLPEVEAALVSHAWISDAYTLVIERRREMVGAVCVLSQEGAHALVELGNAAFQNGLRGALASRLSTLAVPRLWRVVARLPRNAQGKLLAQSVQTLFEGPRLPEVLAEVPRETGCSLRIYVDCSSPYFEGHFPEAAILPGVVQLQWAEELARTYLGLVGEFAGMKSIKFKEVIFPGRVLTLELDWSLDKGELSFDFTSSRGQHSAGHLLYGDPA